MELLNREDEELQKARQALMNNLGSNCDAEYPSGSRNDTGEETTIYEKGDFWVELSSLGGLFVGRIGQDGHYRGGGFGGHHSWQMARENDGYVLYHTTHAHHVSAVTLQETLQNSEFVQTSFGRRELFKIGSTSDGNALAKIIKFALLVDEARTPERHINPPLPPRGGCDPGPSGGGKRSAAMWSARQSPYVKEIGRVLDRLGWNDEISGRPWQPNLLRGLPHSDKRILIEVKPNCSTHNVITAVGQVTCYSSDMVNVIKVIAVQGAQLLPKHVTNVLKSYNIKILDLDEADLSPLIRGIVE